jgi:hypothetical protein
VSCFLLSVEAAILEEGEKCGDGISDITHNLLKPQVF